MFFSFMMLLARSFRALDRLFVPPDTPVPVITLDPPDTPFPVTSLDQLTPKGLFIVGPLLAWGIG